MRVRRHLAAWATAGALTAAATLTGCVNIDAPVVPPKGFLYTHISAPLTADFSRNPAGTANKKASASQIRYFHDVIITGFSAGFDSTAIAQIAHANGIREVSYADYELTSILGIIVKVTVHVYGN